MAGTSALPTFLTFQKEYPLYPDLTAATYQLWTLVKFLKQWPEVEVVDLPTAGTYIVCGWNPDKKQPGYDYLLPIPCTAIIQMDRLSAIARELSEHPVVSRHRSKAGECCGAADLVLAVFDIDSTVVFYRWRQMPESFGVDSVELTDKHWKGPPHNASGPSGPEAGKRPGSRKGKGRPAGKKPAG